MSLARVWTRQLYGAWGAALVAPATMILALAVLAFGGGFGGFSALGQLLSGPAVPAGTSLPGGQAVPTAPATPPLPVVPAGTPPSRAPTLVASTSPAGTGSGPARGGGSLRGRPHGGGNENVGTGGKGAAPPPTRTPPPASAPPTPAPTPTPTPPVTAVVNKVLSVGEAVTNSLPQPVATIGTGTLQSLGQTLNKLLPPL